MKVSVKFYGHLAGAVGPGPYTFAVESAAEIFRALRSQVDGFAQHLIRHSDPGYVVIIDGKCQTYEDLLCLQLPGDGEIPVKVVPCVRGSGDGKGVGATIAGVLLAVIGGITGTGPLVMMGVGMAIGGVLALTTRQGTAAALTQLPEAKPGKKSKKSYFDSLSGTIQQGSPIPIRYGRQTVEGYPVSVRLSVVQDVG